MKVQKFILTLLFFLFLNPLLADTQRLLTRGVLVYNGPNICMDLCSIYFLEADPGFTSTTITHLPDPYVLDDYINMSVEIEGEIVDCLLCSALQADQLTVLEDGDNLVVNGSFESAGDADLSGWTYTCSATSSPDTPPGGGNWSLYLEAGNTQGCFPGQAVQTPVDIGFRDIITLSAWIQPGYGFSVPSLQLVALPEDNGNPLILAQQAVMDTNDWVFVELTDTLINLNPGDQIGIILDAGMTGGPVYDWALFDLVTLTNDGSVHLGDINGDSQVNILDIVTLAGIILGTVTELTDFQLWAADFNQDGNINVMDIVGMIIIPLIP